MYCILQFQMCFNSLNRNYYTIIDFNKVDMRIYLPEKVIFFEAARVDKSSCLPKLKSITVLIL